MVNIVAECKNELQRHDLRQFLPTKEKWDPGTVYLACFLVNMEPALFLSNKLGWDNQKYHFIQKIGNSEFLHNSELFVLFFTFFDINTLKRKLLVCLSSMIWKYRI